MNKVLRMALAPAAAAFLVLAKAEAAWAQAASQPAAVNVDMAIKSIQSSSELACVLAGGAVLVALVIRWKLQTLARNQIELAKMIQSLKK